METVTESMLRVLLWCTHAQRVWQCRGHSSTVTQLDWSADSSVIMTNDQSYDILIWDPHTGKKVVHTQHNQTWHTWTCTLGFPVMGIWKVQPVNKHLRDRVKRFISRSVGKPLMKPLQNAHIEEVPSLIIPIAKRC